MNRRGFGLLLAFLASVAWVIADDFPPVIDTEPDRTPLMAPDHAAAAIRTPKGFQVGVFAAEPEVRNPIGLAWDGRGRLWIAENYTYAERSARFDLRHRDRVLIFEDQDGDGRSDRRSVFTDDVQMLTSVEVGRGGVWLMCPPNLLFVADVDGDDHPDAAPEVVLDGFTVPAENYHNFANGLRWGPDGWLYGRCGASSPGLVGVPGCPEADRVPLTGGIWRFDPKSKRVEVLNHGTTNPWGLDWDARGEAFFINTVNGHLWHSIPGAHFVRPHTIDPNTRAYAAIDQHADHFHWDTAKDWSDSRKPTPEHDGRGGGHAHSGLLIYNGGQWPAGDQGKLFTLNFHGRRTNVERLERAGSGFVGKHEPDRFFAGDPKFRGIDLDSGPDGGVFVLDWNDSGECHDSTGVHRNSGRIFKVTATLAPRPTTTNNDITRLDPAALAALHRDPNRWFPRAARRELADRAHRGETVAAAVPELRAILAAPTAPVEHRLEALWTLFGLDQLDAASLRATLRADHEALRVWGIRLLTDRLPLDSVQSRRPLRGDVELAPDLLDEFGRMARTDGSGLVRLALASTLQRLPVHQRLALAGGLVARGEDAADPNLPLLIWYGLIPVVEADPSGLVRLAERCALPTTRRFIARAVSESLDKAPGPVASLLATAGTNPDPRFAADIVGGIAEGLRGWRKAPKPEHWDALAARLTASGDPGTVAQVRDLGVVFGDGRALDEVRRVVFDTRLDLETRQGALRTLIEDRPADLRATCEALLKVRFLNATAARGLTRFDDPAVGRTLVASYGSFHPSERPALVDALVARPTFARALLDGVAAGSIPRGDISAFQARQVRTFGDPALASRLAETWGALRDSPTAKREAIDRLKVQATPEALARADRGRGRVVFNTLCASCHQLHGQGGAIGPDLTGSGRHNLDYLLENILDPSAVVNADFKVQVVELKDGRVLNGLIRASTDRTITLQAQNEAVVLPRSEIDRTTPSPMSLMPEGLLDPLPAADVVALFAYLMHPAQVPLPDPAVGSPPR